MRSIEEKRRLEKKEAERWGYPLHEFDAGEQKVIAPYWQTEKRQAILYFPVDASLTYKIQKLYRVDSRHPENIYPEGFLSRGKNPDLYEHIFTKDPSGVNQDSGHVATSKDPAAAMRFPMKLTTKESIQHLFFFEIITPERGRDVVKELPRLLKETSQRALYNVRSEQEVAFLHKIDRQYIKGAWQVEAYQMGLTLPEYIKTEGILSGDYYRLLKKEPGMYFSNPYFVEPAIPNLQDVNYNPRGALLLKAAKYAGYGLTGLGVAMDAHSLYRAYQHGEQKRDFTSTYTEASRIVGGWAGAVRLGTFSAQKALLYSAPLSPLGQTVAVITVGFGGAAIGYYCGGEALQWLYNLNRRDDLIKPLYSERIDTDTLRGTITTLKDGARIGRFSYNSASAQDNYNAKKQSETQSQKHYFSSLMANIDVPATNNPTDLYLTVLNQQTQSINQLFQPHYQTPVSNPLFNSIINTATARESESNICILGNVHPQQAANQFGSTDLLLAMNDNIKALNSLQQRQADNACLDNNLAVLQRNTPINFNGSGASAQMQALKQSQDSFNQCLASNRGTDCSLFTNHSNQTYYFDTASEAAKYSTFFSQYISGNFCERPRPVSSYHGSFFAGRGDWGGKGSHCDIFGNCYSSSGSSSDCRSSDRCSSSLF